VDIRFLGVLSLSICNLALGILVYRKNPHSAAHRWFGLFTLSVAVWSIGLAFLYYGIGDERLALFAGRLVFAAASFIPYCFLIFSKTFPSQDQFPSNVLLNSLGIASTGFALLSFSPWLVSSVRSVGTRIQPLYGPLHPVFAAYFFVCLGLSLFVLARKLKRASGLAKLQLRYLFLGLLIACTGGTTTNLIIPLVLGTSVFGGYGPLFVLVLIAFTAHAIIRYRVMDIKVFIRKGVVYVCAVGVATSVFIGLVWLGSYLAAYDRDSIPLVAAVAIALLVAIFFQPVKRWIEDSLNRYLYRQAYDYQRTVREASRRLSTILDLQSLLSYIGEVTAKTFKSEMVAVYMRDHPQQALTLRVLQRPSGWEQEASGPVLSGASPLVAFLEHEKRTLISDEVPRNSGNLHFSAAAQELRALGGDIAFPFFQDQAVSGILVVGPKLSGDPYFQEDIDLLTTLAGQAGIAIKNAQLYREVTLANESLENILKTMESGVIAVGAAGTVTLSNPAALRMTGLTADQLSGATVDRLPKALAGPLASTLRTGESVLQVEAALRDPAGGIVPVVCSTSPLQSPEGDVHGAVVVWSDLSRLKELEGEKRRVERLASFGALATGIAHEIKNPLVAIKTFFDLLPERYTDVEFREGFAKVAVKEVERINNLVERLRDLTAPSLAPLRLLDLREPIEETLMFLSGQLEQQQVSVIRRYEEPLPPVDGNLSQLKQFFLNVIMNALEATAPGGEITVRLRGLDRYGVPSLLAEVSDTGNGIPEPLLDRLFEPFVTTKAKGTGLGLAICRGIADSHRATIRAENNREGRGATIAIEFPVSSETPVALNR
jgi:PAS domain S-box-containing protein